VGKALGIKATLPAWQIVKEKRATFAATPEQDARRPAAKPNGATVLRRLDPDRTARHH